VTSKENRLAQGNVCLFRPERIMAPPAHLAHLIQELAFGFGMNNSRRTNAAFPVSIAAGNPRNTLFTKQLHLVNIVHDAKKGVI
jgi:hypothetical protein